MAGRAAAQNQQYVELMETPVFSHAAYLASQNSLPQNPTVEDFAKYRQTLFAVGLRDEIFVDHYAATRQWEEREFRKAITDWELQRYFEII